MKYCGTLATLVVMLSGASVAVAEEVKTTPSYLNNTESWVKIIGGAIAAAAAIVAAFKALAEWRRSNEKRGEELTERREELELREREFRHKQAMFARNLISEVFADPKSRAALTMLDWDESDHEDDAGTTYNIRQGEIKEAMDPHREATDKEAFIRTRFEALYDHLEQIAHLISLRVVDFADFKTPFRYYIKNALHPDVRHIEFLDYFDYPEAKAFLLRFEKEKARKRRRRKRKREQANREVLGDHR